MSDQSVRDILMGGGGAPSASFPTIGTLWKGTVLESKTSQQTDINQEPKTWPNGDPMMQVVVTLQTDVRDPNLTVNNKPVVDDGKRRLFIKGQMLAAVRQAILDAGCDDIAVGAKLAVKYDHDGEKKPGKSAAKQYVAQYAPPAVSVNDMLDTPAQAPVKQSTPQPVAASSLLD